MLKDISKVKEKITESYEKHNTLSTTLNLFSNGEGLSDLSDSDLDSLEQTLLARLETIQSSKLKQNLRMRLNSIQDTLKKQVPSQILKELVNFSVNIN